MQTNPHNYSVKYICINLGHVLLTKHCYNIYTDIQGKDNGKLYTAD